MPQSGGVAPPRARRRRPAPQAFGSDLEWESASGPSGRAGRRAVAEPILDAQAEPWFAALPRDLLAPDGPDDGGDRRSSAPERGDRRSSAPERDVPDAALAAASPTSWTERTDEGPDADGFAAAPRLRDADADPLAALAESVEASWAPTYDPVTGRRTVTIRGRGAERATPPARSSRRDRPAVPRHERSTFRADRTAMWAVLLGVMLLLAAVTSAHGATVHLAVHHHAPAHLAPLVRQLPDLARTR